MYKTSEIFSYLTKKYPLRLQEKWDQSGKITFFDTKVTGVLVCLDVNTVTVNEALKKKCNLIVSHHPIFTKSKEYPLSKKEKEIVQTLTKNKISLVALHTCFDNNPNGMNYSFLRNSNIFKNIKVLKNTNGSYATANLTISKTTTELISFISTKMKPSRVIGLNEFKKEGIKKVAVCCGSGFSVLKPLIEKNTDIDLFITGDVKWHDWQFASLYDANVLDVGHDIENLFINVINKDLSYFDELKTCLLPSNKKFIIK